VGRRSVALPPTRYASIKYWLAASIWSLWAPLGNAVAQALHDALPTQIGRRTSWRVAAQAATSSNAEGSSNANYTVSTPNDSTDRGRGIALRFARPAQPCVRYPLLWRRSCANLPWQSTHNRWVLCPHSLVARGR
jgi:hypothetical protein